MTTSEQPGGDAVEESLGLFGWLEEIFYAGVELSVLGTPGFLAVFLTQHRYPDAVPLAGLTALAVGYLALAVFRQRTIDTGKWPRRGELTSAPLRFTYFSVLFFLAAYGVGAAAMTLGSYWYTLFGGVVIALGLAAFPTVYRLVHGDPTTKPAEMV
ncbi:hypothetical protein [Natranaeroarchaeum sulfidigenes]|uniref:DUF8215 domain-containing protein n=1 Tax=Natranaeroarchaeum sulfidigenes TaxID=2784880 RepID=A0A897MZ42_9EURY|nr:hypothetical protein [Natranaeroarchaeum sulfidigenes]QSG04149.1 hypothetical protein AArcS_2962 [Natranaeroarchaeum sulfidigenes]